jgi:multicomponent Na+:H+ antiporter subunit C
MIGLYCAVVKKNMVKIALGILIMEYAVNLFLILLGYRKGGIAPIVVDREDIFASGSVTDFFINNSVDPLPQALVLTADDFNLHSSL